MPRFPHLRVIIESESHTGRWNMAVDETLLETAISNNIATLRWYRWSEPTVSLGYFQKYVDLVDDAVLSRLPVVRRLSGGGAILHDDELTYCFALPSSQTLFRQPHELYDIVHEAIILGLRHLGFPVEFRGKTLKRRDEPMLCFHRLDEHDIIVGGSKILGSAQRRRRGAIMQHGSLLRHASPFANNVPGLSDLCHTLIPDNLSETLAVEVAEVVAETWSIGVLTESEIDAVKKICPQVDLNVQRR